MTPLGKDLPGSAAVFHDVTELRRLEKVRKDFVANVSHELRTPITAIRGYAETLQSGALKDPEVAPKMVEIIHRQSERLSELVEDLLELSRLESREVQLTAAPPCPWRQRRRASGGDGEPQGGGQGHPPGVRTCPRSSVAARRRASGRAGAPQPAGQRGEVHARRRAGAP